MATPAAKACSDCGVEKPLDEFSSHVSGLYGRRPYCKACAADRSRRWRQRNRDKVRAQKRRHWERYKDERNAQRRAPDQRQRQNELRRARYWEEPDVYRERQRRARAKAPEKFRARLAVWQAINAGELEREPCEVCGDTNSQAHHEDYSRPLDVVWLCPLHHTAHHREGVI